MGERLERRNLLAAEITVDVETLTVDSTDQQEFRVGSPIERIYRVSNTGDIPLINVDVTDDSGTLSGDDDFSPSPILQEDLEPIGRAGFSVKELAISQATRWLAHPTQPILFATNFSDGTVNIINSATLEVEDTIAVGDEPVGMALSLDFNTLYVALRGNDAIAIVDWIGRDAGDLISMASTPTELEVGGDGRLYVATRHDGIQQIDPTDGSVIESQFFPSSGGGSVRINAAKDRLYYASTSTGFTLIQYDVSDPDNPIVLWRPPRYVNSSYARSLFLSNDGKYLSFDFGPPENGPAVLRYNTDGMWIESALPSDGRTAEFSADGEFAYTTQRQQSGNPFPEIHLWDANARQLTTRVPVPDGLGSVKLSQNEEHLFVRTSEDVSIYTTGRRRRANAGDLNKNFAIDPGETWQYSATATTRPGRQINEVTVSAVAHGKAIRASATEEYTGLGPLLTLQRKIDDVARTELSSPLPRVLAHAVSDFGYYLSNEGTVDFSNVQVQIVGASDSHLDFVIGDENEDQRLNPGETWQFSRSVHASEGPNSQRVVISANSIDPETLPTVSPITTIDLDDSFFGVNQSIKVGVQVNGTNAVGTAVELPGDSNVRWQYSIENTGNVPLNAPNIEHAGTDANLNEIYSTFAPPSVPPEYGTFIAQFEAAKTTTFSGERTSHLLKHPTKNLVFATDFLNGQVEVIDSLTLEHLSSVTVGLGASGMSLSLDGNTLFVANRLVDYISVVDVNGFVEVDQIRVVRPASRVLVDRHSRLIVSDADGVYMLEGIDYSIRTDFFVDDFEGTVSLTHDKSRMFLRTHNGTTLYQYDMTVDPPERTYEGLRLFQPNGSAAETISHDDRFLFFVEPEDQHTVGVFKRHKYTVDGVVDLGSIEMDFNFFDPLAFSSDDRFIYGANDFADVIDVWDTTSLEQVGRLDLNESPHDILVDWSGRYLFATFDERVVVYSTGRWGSRNNSGDTNLNRMIDPGETWLFESDKLNPTNDPPGQVVTVDAVDDEGQLISERVSVLDDVRQSLMVSERVSGAAVANVDPNLDYELSDPRFEIVEGKVRLKPSSFLVYPADHERQLWITTLSAQQHSETPISLHVKENIAPWQHPEDIYDVTDDGAVTVGDALVIINILTRVNSLNTEYRPHDAQYFYDTSGDGDISAIDALRVINEVAKRNASVTLSSRNIQIGRTPSDELSSVELELLDEVFESNLF